MALISPPPYVLFPLFGTKEKISIICYHIHIEIIPNINYHIQTEIIPNISYQKQIEIIKEYWLYANIYNTQHKMQIEVITNKTYTGINT